MLCEFKEIGIHVFRHYTVLFVTEWAQLQQINGLYTKTKKCFHDKKT